jgi:mediator of RNA polymerase II transcription subunit 12
MESNSAVAHVLKNLSQWTLNNSLVHIKLHIAQAVSSHTRQSLLDDLASQVIQVFEESCGSEWAGQGQTESPSDSGDGAYSPSVWLVTPLISKLQQVVLGRVLKCAGHVLGQGQWWNPDRGQEKRRSTRATSGAVPAKTGLQWQQPFLQLVLACMNAQATTHEELLGPLKSQLQSFLAAFDKDGMPTDEPSKSMLYAALKLRLSLVGSMLGTICSSDTTALDWTTLLMQLICSGAVDRQTDSSELFTNCLDMLATLLHSLPTSFHICLAGSGEEGKKVYNVCIKKLKSELSGAKSSCLSEIQQLFPLAERPFEVFTVKQPALNMPKAPGEKILGLRIQDSREISPWDIIEGVKNSGPLMLSWFGAVRMKRKPLKYVEQRRNVHFHTHQKRFGDMVGRRHFVSLPDPVPISDSETASGDAAVQLETPTTATSKLPGVSQPLQPQESGQRPGAPTGVNQVPLNTAPKPETSAPPMGMGPRPTIRPQQPQQIWGPRGPMQPNQQQRMQMTLRRIQKDQLEQQRRFVAPYGHPMARPSHYSMMGQMQARPPHMGAYGGMSAMQQQQRARLQMQMQMMTPEQKQIYIHRVRMRQQQAAQQQAAMNQGMMGAPQYGAQYPPQHPQMQMQAVPPMPVQQQMQHGYNQQPMMVQQQQYPPQQPGGPMDPMQRPMY